ncbi:ATP-dependent DNA helicase, partial [Burkholderia cepacia]
MNSPLEATPDARRDVSSAGRARAPEGTFELSRKRVDELDTIFGEGGLLARALDGYRPRTSQIEMARAVASAMEASARRMPEPEIFETRKRPARRLGDGDKAAETGADAAAAEPDSDAGDNTLIVEAGTGTGKTYAYLVPAMLWGGKVIVSTGTKHLQDQLFQRDIPTVRNALAVPVSVAMLKGRANYLCHYYLQRTADNGRLPSRQDTAYLQEIVRFAKITKSGDKAELASVPETAPVWSMVTSTRDNCLGQECPHYKECFVMQARREAQQADVVVVNHHLFFADIMLRDTGMAELLPNANTVIFDEAHQLPETATLFFGETLSTTQILELARDTVAEGLSHARDAVEWVKLGGDLERAARDLRLAFANDQIVRMSLAQLGDDHPMFGALDALEAALDALASALASQAERAESLGACLRRARELQDLLAGWVAPGATEAAAKADAAAAGDKAASDG